MARACVRTHVHELQSSHLIVNVSMGNAVSGKNGGLRTQLYETRIQGLTGGWLDMNTTCVYASVRALLDCAVEACRTCSAVDAVGRAIGCIAADVVRTPTLCWEWSTERTRWCVIYQQNRKGKLDLSGALLERLSCRMTRARPYRS
jgi:hypothetical protein